ncbi:MAG: cation transporter [SAR202 cluster bacterium]|nr:cation transporter [SAR202 cluster bacterium]
MDNCCQDKECELAVLRERQSRTLWLAIGINAAMFGLEIVVGLLAGSTAVLADSLDMLGDALVYGFSLYVVGRSLRWRASAALLKGLIMGGFGLVVLAQALYRLWSGDIPSYQLMGVMGILALAANMTCLLLLTRHRHDDLNMRSVWLCSRNDIIANVGVLVAAAGVLATRSQWPDLVVGLLITLLFMRSAVLVVRQALVELGNAPASIAVQRRTISLLQFCRAGTCPAGACRCRGV